ncbi:MAG: putative DNA binding domain-containing protein [Gammaproteobacteria bacterium]|nr:putative DNA binding domain-containing protein [Gammaproteobacteria bacterium]
MSAIAMVERAKSAIDLGESHFREFKSGLDGAPGEKVNRSIKSIATNIAQTLVAFANADGGELLVGVEDSGEITGLNSFSEKELGILEQSPGNRIHKDTPLPTVKRHRLSIDGKVVLYFSVPKSTKYIHITSDGRCLQRNDLESVPVSAEALQFERDEEKSREYDRQFVDGASADDLDVELVRIVADQILKGMSPEKCLQYLELGEYGLSSLRLRKAAMLLFSKEPTRWHPRLQIRIMKVDGTSVLTGEEYNVVSDETIPGNIVTLVEKAWEALRPHLVHTKLDPNARFSQKSIYPELACKEALLNAIAHRDYSEEGRGIEVYIFTDHLEIRNPGELLSTIELNDIVKQTGAHQSRNTYIARVLRELGYMRELGEGMRRIYDLMHKNELAPPTLQSGEGGFTIRLTHRPLYSDKDLLWLGQFDGFDLDREQKAIILLGQEGAIFSAKDVWDAVGIVDTEHYRLLVDSLIRFGILGNQVERNKAKRLARNKKIPFREYPRYCINIPSSEKPTQQKDPEIRVVVEQEDVRTESNRLYVGNIPFNITESEVYDALSGFGDLEEIVIPRRHDKSKGYCFVEYSDNVSAKAVLDSDKEVRIQERKLYFRKAKGSNN